MAVKKKMSFEQQLEAVEQMVTRLEQGGLPLDETVTMYENGVKMLSELEKQLATAEQRLTVIRRDADGETVETPMEAES